MNAREQLDVMLEATLGAHRERDADGLPLAPPQWWDLSPGDREEAYRRQVQARHMESLLDERGWSSTVRAVMDRIG